MKQITLRRETGAAEIGPGRCTGILIAIWLVYGWAMAALWRVMPHTVGTEISLWLIAFIVGVGLARTLLETQ